MGGEEASEVLRSLWINPDSKTPYSDATQVLWGYFRRFILLIDGVSPSNSREQEKSLKLVSLSLQ